MPDQNSFILSFLHALMKFKNIETKLNLQSQKRFNERKYQYLKYKNKYHSGPDT